MVAMPTVPAVARDLSLVVDKSVTWADLARAVREAAGANLGWSGYEGSEVFIEDRVQDGAVPPVFEYTHSDGGCSITGGEVYRGERTPELVGTYLFGDYCENFIRVLNPADNSMSVFATPGTPSSSACCPQRMAISACSTACS